MSASPSATSTNSLVVNLAGSSQVQPTFWLNPENGVSYPIVTQTPQYQVDSLNALRNLPITAAGRAAADISAAIADDHADRHRRRRLALRRAAGDRHLRRPRKDAISAPSPPISQRILDETARRCRAAHVVLRGQVHTMTSALQPGSIFGLAGAIVLIYLVIVVNFQSWLDPFIIITALPAALAGIVWMLFMTGTTLSVPALTGAIMCMGVATANSILLVSFARERLEAHGDAVAAALEAGFTRFRPVLMTALAMIIGMLPMALGLGEGGEQNAPLGRAVIGGLICATVATLMFVPVVFSIIHGRRGKVGAPALGEPHAA